MLQQVEEVDMARFIQQLEGQIAAQVDQPTQSSVYSYANMLVPEEEQI